MKIIVYWFALIIIGIFTWVILSATLFPVFRVMMKLFFPELWNNTFEKPVIVQTKDTVKYFYTSIFMRALIIVWTTTLCILALIYAIYYIAKYILLTNLITAPFGKAILDFVIIKEFVDFGIFGVFDSTLAMFMPSLFIGGDKPRPINDAVVNFANTFVSKVKAEEKLQEDTRQSIKTGDDNPNLTTEQNKAVNAKYDKCMKDITGDKKGNKDQVGILIENLNKTRRKIICEIQKIQDTLQIKDTK